MRKPNFNKLSSTVLTGYKSEIEQILKDRKQTDEKKSKVLKRIKTMVESEGLSLDSLLEQDTISKPRKTAVKKTAKKVSPKYADPKDKSKTWSGRGRKPLWVDAHLKKGGKLEDLAIK